MKIIFNYKKIKSIFGLLIKFLLKFFITYTLKNISDYGKFKLLPAYFFSNYDNWNSKHNDCFNICLELTKDKKCFIDVGAHIGLVTLPAATIMKNNSKIISFEPSIVNYKILNDHLKLNKNLIKSKVMSENLIVSNISKKNVIFYEDISYSSGVNSLIKNKNNLSMVFRNQVSLDDYCLERKIIPDIIKVDVEGNEYNVLLGSKKIIEKFKPIFILSVHPKQLLSFNASKEMLFKLINSLEYLVKDSNNFPVNHLNFQEYILKPNDK